MRSLTGRTTDLYPRGELIAAAIVLIVWNADTKNGLWGLAPDCDSEAQASNNNNNNNNNNNATRRFVPFPHEDDGWQDLRDWW